MAADICAKPRHITIEAPDWNVSGVRPDGVPEEQIFFVRKNKSTTGEASYDRQEFHTVAAIERNLQLGLAWQVRSTARRLSPPGTAIALRVPLLPGEKVLSANTNVKDNMIEVRLGANDSEFVWESELGMTDQISLTASTDATWVERWRLVASPVWNIDISPVSHRLSIPTIRSSFQSGTLGWRSLSAVDKPARGRSGRYSNYKQRPA